MRGSLLLRPIPPLRLPADKGVGTMNSAIASAEPMNATALRRRTRSPFYSGLAVLMIGLALAGFWPQYYSSIVVGVIPEPTRHPLIHLHSSLFVAWLLAFLGQAVLIWRGRLRLH